MMCPRIEYIYANMIIFGMTFYVDMSLIDTLVHALSLSLVCSSGCPDRSTLPLKK